MPRLFEAEGVGRLLRDDRELGAALARLSADGRDQARRAARRLPHPLLRGGEAADLRFFITLHDTCLDPAAEEVRATVRDYAAMLDAPAANCRRPGVTAAPPVEGHAAAEAVESLLFRSEGRLVRAGLRPARPRAQGAVRDVGRVRAALAAALVCESPTARGRRVKSGRSKHAGRFGPDAVGTIREIVPMLPPGPAPRWPASSAGEAVCRRSPRAPASSPRRCRPCPKLSRCADHACHVLAASRCASSTGCIARAVARRLVRLGRTPRRESLTRELGSAGCAEPGVPVGPWWDISDWAAAWRAS
ncbi:hypothetical protein [Nonomuraea rubra]|uniref:hypothetical protein n=1 Tax=Nonomuraea rubra TaxID=46180 RepID=UPI0031EB342F